MAMLHNGLAKLGEECGELMQVHGKMLQYPHLQTVTNLTHPDGTNLRDRMEEEMGDVLGSITFVIEKLKLNEARILERANKKCELFKTWDNE